MFNAAITATLCTADTTVRGTVRAIDQWQDWSDRNCGQAQEITLGVIELAAYFTGVSVALFCLGINWAATVLVLCNIGAISQFAEPQQAVLVAEPSRFAMWSKEMSFDLGPELEPAAILAAIERHIPAAAQSVTEPAAILVLGDTDTLADLRREACKAYNCGIDTAKDLARAYGHIGRKNTWRELIAACNM